MAAAKVLVLIALLIGFLAIAEAIGGDCPSYSQHTQCAPKCLQDHECGATGGKCCPNLCNARSCVRPKAGSNGLGDKYAASSSSATGVYCGSQKCKNGETCDERRRQCVSNRG